MTRVSDIEVVSSAVLFGFSEVAPINFYEEYEEARMMSDAKEVIRLEEEVFKFKVFRFYRGMSYDEFNKSRHEFNDYYDNLNELIGYNIKAYDFKILTITRYVLTDVTTPEEYIEAIKSLSDGIIHTQQTPFDDNRNLWKAASKIKLIDLYTLHRLDYYHVSLKQCAILLKWWKVQDYDFETVDAEEFPDVDMLEDYNKNDILITGYLFHKSKDELISRFVAEEMFGQDFRSKSRSSMADSIMSILYSQITTLEYKAFSEKRTYRRIVKLKDAIHPLIKFKTKELNDFLKTLRQTTIEIFRGDKFSAKFQLGEIIYQLGEGGIHSKDKAAKFEEDDEWFIIDADVTSYYPNLVLNEQVCPAHIAPVAFNQIVKTVVIKRTDAKNLSKKYKGVDPILYKKYSTEADGLKIVANSGLFGFFGSGDKWLFDIKCTYQTTLNGQLYLLMLIEELEENGIEVISANTDGIVCKFPIYLESLYNQICVNWQKLTNLNLEYTDYYKYVRTSVNDYIAIKTSYLNSGNREDVKLKGDFISTPSIKKGYNAPIVALALDKYYVENISYEETIRNHLDIYDFCIGVKTGENYVKSLHSLKDNVLNIEELSKNLRYFVSNKGGTLLKTNDVSQSNMLKGYQVTAFNDYYPVSNFSDYNLNYRYYIRRAEDIVLKINGVYDKPRTTRGVPKRSKGSKFTGRLFDGEI